MYLGIDVGGSKVMFAVFKKDGPLVSSHKIKTNYDYKEFKQELKQEIDNLLRDHEITHICTAFPGRFDFPKGIALDFGNLPWHDVPVRNDIEKMAPGTEILVHNDAKLAGLSESKFLKGKYNKILYVTIGTGIGGGVISKGQIDPDFVNFEPGQMIFEHQGKFMDWEDFASGRSIKERFGKLASEISSASIWDEYTKDLFMGFEDLLATVQPDAIIIGGGVGAHFEKFKPYLEEKLKKIKNPLVPIPPMFKAKRPEEAVIYGCYDYIKQQVG